MIKYVGYYYLPESKYKRNGSLAAINKMNYIIDAIVRSGNKVNIISSSWYSNDNAPKTKRQDIKISENVVLTHAPSWSTKNRYTRYIKSLFSRFWLFLYLLVNAKKDEEIIAYHSLSLITPILFAKKIKGFKLILETEEVYTDVIKCSGKIKKMEYKFINSADKYMFSTELLNNKLNNGQKPHIVNYGTYKTENDFNSKSEDGKIHIIYAGTFEPRKGSSTAVAVAEHLDENYHVHIIGFGSDEERKNLLQLIDNTSKKTKCTITYDGLLSGNDYNQFLQKCHIGLSTQTPDAAYNETSFPSKVLSYLSNGLRVVSVRIKALECSKISDLLYFYDTNSPKAISDAIKNIDMSDGYDSRKKIEELDIAFVSDIKRLLEK